MYPNYNSISLLRNLWEKAFETPDATCEASVKHLSEGQTYQFRVIAVNRAGQSEPSDSSKGIVAKPRFRKYIHIIK